MIPLPLLRLAAVVVVTWTAATAPAAAAGETTAPVAVVERLHAALLEAMRDADRLGVRGRYRMLEPTVVSSFDFTTMVRIMTGRSAWRGAGEDVRKSLAEAFRRFSVGTYASQFDGYGGEAFVTVGNENGPRDTILVHTRIDRPGDSPVELTYVVTARDGRWRIIDVLAEGSISELARRRSEYQSVIKRDGIDGLVSVLNRKAELLIAQ